MKNRIWVGKNSSGDVIASFVQPKINGAGMFWGNNRGLFANCHFNSCFGLDLRPLEIVELIYDTETGEVEVKRPREFGWWLVRMRNRNAADVMHWNGINWTHARINNEYCKYNNDEVEVISEKLPYNEYLKSLE